MSVQVPLSCSEGVVGQTGWLVSLTRQLHPPTVPLSLITSLGTPRRLVKRAKAFKNVSVSSTQAISKCTARVSKQVKRHSHLFCRGFPRPWTVYKGPAKSTVVWAKGLKLKRSLVFGSGAIIWQAGLLRLLLHSLHSWSHSRISSRAAISKISHSTDKEWSLLQRHGFLFRDSSPPSVHEAEWLEI